MAITTQDRSELVNELLERIAQTVGENAKGVDDLRRSRRARGRDRGSGCEGTVRIRRWRRVRNREEGEGQGRGGGAGVAVTPVGFIEFRDNSAEFKRISTPEICWRSSPPPRLPSSVSGGCSTESLVAAGRRGGAHRLRRLDDGSMHEDLCPVRPMLDTDGVHELTDHGQAAST
jgi:hypothetical protein